MSQQRANDVGGSIDMPLGGLISLALLIPNIAWAFLPPSESSTPQLDGPTKPLRAPALLEQVARVGVFAVPFFYTLVPLHPVEMTALVAFVAALTAYYICWFRYFTRGRSVRLLYQPLWGVPVPLAVSPVICFAAATVLLHATWLVPPTVLLSLTHVPSSYREARRLFTPPVLGASARLPCGRR